MKYLARMKSRLKLIWSAFIYLLIVLIKTLYCIAVGIPLICIGSLFWSDDEFWKKIKLMYG